MERHGSVHRSSRPSLPSPSPSPSTPQPTLPAHPPTDLFEAIELYGPFCEQEAGVIFAQLVGAVKHLWDAGWLHRDVKDENVVVDVWEGGLECRLIDFGSATPIPTHVSPVTGELIRQAQFEQFYGTMTYASPEVLRGERYDGEKQEVWSLGIVLYCLLFGEAPFSTPTAVLSAPLPLAISPAVLSAVRSAHPSTLSLRPTSPLLQDPVPR
ncbi:hypothetical protein HDU93_003901, partial [Gonapodya sp. JEL0774]